MNFLIKIPALIRRFYPKRIWSISNETKALFLTFDDGPHPTVTTFVLDELKKINAKATFFCIGKNVLQYPDIYKRIILEGHAVGNHTMNHLNGWKTKDDVYLNDIFEAKKIIDSKLFRPPYGRLTSFQERQLYKPLYKLQVIMWSVLSGDFDEKISAEQCSQNAILNTKGGDIVVFHDSEKAGDKLMYALPILLKMFNEKGYAFKAINDQILA